MTPAVQDMIPACEQARFNERHTDLISRGYRDVDDHKGMRVGRRVRHRGEQYRAAYSDGTGVIVTVMERPDSAWSRTWHMPDVELIILRDRPRFVGDARLMFVAQYHVEFPNCEVRS